MTIVTAEIFVNAPAKLLYRAFTNSTALREWMCDVATVESHVNGRMYLWWNGDFYSSGHYLELETDKEVKFRWYSSIDPAPTEVTVTFNEKDNGTIVRLEHETPEDDSWKKLRESFHENWADSFRNLKSIFETGIDLRIAERPLLGIVPGTLTDEQASALGIPVREGLRLDSVLEGMGAHNCGLRKDDVIVEFAGHTINNQFSSMANALGGKKGGDKVNVVYYRGPEKISTEMELTRRVMPAVPFDPAELEKKARPLYEAALSNIQKTFEGFTDEQAMHRTEPNEWSALETVAHLVSGERFNLIFLNGLIDGYEPVTDGFGSNIHAQVEATVKAHPSIQLMLDLLRRASEETLAFTALIPAEFVLNKGSYYRFGQALLQPNFHLTTHLEQIQNALTAAK